MHSESKICLIRPPGAESFRFSTATITPPLGLAYIAAAIEGSGRRVHVLDAVAEAPEQLSSYYVGYLIGLRCEEVVERIPSDATSVGISVIFTHEWPMAVRLVELIKRARPDLPVILGGEQITSMPEFCLLTSRADFAVLGEGEETIIELLDAIEQGKGGAEIAGVVYRDGDRVVHNPRRARVADIDSIAPPAWHLFDLRTYHESRFRHGIYSEHLSVPILATRGCPYQCTFCSAPNMWTPRWIPRDPEKVLDEIESYVQDYGARDFPFQDLTAIITKKWIVEFCEGILRRGLDITWQLPVGTRTEAIDHEVAALLKRTRMVGMAYSPESGSETTRQYIKKKVDRDHMFESIDAAVANDLAVTTMLVLGFPHDGRECHEETLELLDELAAHGVSDAGVGFYMALPGTEMFYSLYDAGKISIDRRYFKHILSANTLMPSQSYCEFSRFELARWKIRYFYRFYRGRGAKRGDGGFATEVMRGLRGLFDSGTHESTLTTVLRNARTSALGTLKSRFQRPRWMPAAEERAMFADWDRIFRSIREQKFAQGVSAPFPSDSSELHRQNVIPLLRQDHASASSYTAA